MACVYAYHDYYISKHFFVGKDQTIFNALLVLFNEHIITVWVHDPKAPAANSIRAQPTALSSITFSEQHSAPIASASEHSGNSEFWPGCTLAPSLENSKASLDAKNHELN
jgi:hypothetical protein